MKAIELLKNQESLLVVDAIQSKKMKALASSLNELIIEMNNQIKTFETFNESQISGEQGNKIIVAKSLCKFFEGNKFLKVELAVDALRNEEKNVINEYYTTKNKLLDTIRTIMKESSKEAIVCAYDLFEGDFVKCQEGHEIIILGDRNQNVLDTFLQELDMELIVDGAFESIEGQEVDYNTEVLNRNIELCNRKNNEVYGAKQGKFAKIESIIEKLREIGDKAVAFFTYKDALADIGCNQKGINDYENELSKNYIPLKKVLQKEFKIELEDINNVVVDENTFGDVDIEQPIEPQLESFAQNIEESQTLESAQTSFNSYEPSTQTPSYNEPQNEPFTSQAPLYNEEPTQPSFETPNENINTYSESQNTFANNFANESPVSETISSDPFEDNSYNETPDNTYAQSNSNDAFNSMDSNTSLDNTYADNNSYNSFESSTNAQNPFDDTSSNNNISVYESNINTNENNSFENSSYDNSSYDNSSYDNSSYENSSEQAPMPDLSRIEDEINNDNIASKSPLDNFFNSQYTQQNPQNDNNSSNPFGNSNSFDNSNPFDN